MVLWYMLVDDDLDSFYLWSKGTGNVIVAILLSNLENESFYDSSIFACMFEGAKVAHFLGYPVTHKTYL